MFIIKYQIALKIKTCTKIWAIQFVIKLILKQIVLCCNA